MKKIVTLLIWARDGMGFPRDFPPGTPSENPCHPSLRWEEYYKWSTLVKHISRTTAWEWMWPRREGLTSGRLIHYCKNFIVWPQMCFSILWTLMPRVFIDQTHGTFSSRLFEALCQLWCNNQKCSQDRQTDASLPYRALVRMNAFQDINLNQICHILKIINQ